MKRVFAAMMMASATALAVAAPVPAAAQTDAARARAMQIAKLLNDPADIVGVAQNQFLDGIRAATKGDPEAAAVERAFPGFFEEFGQAMLPVFIELVSQGLPILWERQADFFYKTYTPAELDQLYAFYSSASGKRLIALMGEHFDGDAMADAMGNSGDKVTADAIDAGVQGALPAIVARMTPADRKAILNMIATPAGKKMAAAAPQLQEVSVAWVNQVLLENPAFKTAAEQKARAIIERRQAGAK